MAVTASAWSQCCYTVCISYLYKPNEHKGVEQSAFGRRTGRQQPIYFQWRDNLIERQKLTHFQWRDIPGRQWRDNLIERQKLTHFQWRDNLAFLTKFCKTDHNGMYFTLHELITLN